MCVAPARCWSICRKAIASRSAKLWRGEAAPSSSPSEILRGSARSWSAGRRHWCDLYRPSADSSSRSESLRLFCPMLAQQLSYIKSPTQTALMRYPPLRRLEKLRLSFPLRIFNLQGRCFFLKRRTVNLLKYAFKLVVLA